MSCESLLKVKMICKIFRGIGIEGVNSRLYGNLKCILILFSLFHMCFINDGRYKNQVEYTEISIGFMANLLKFAMIRVNKVLHI